MGVERQGLRRSLSHITEGEWRADFMGDSALIAPRGYGVAPTPVAGDADGGVGGDERAS